MEKITAPVAMARMLARLPTAVPSSMGYFYSPRLAHHIRQELAATNFDLIFVHCSSVAPYVADVRGVPKILDFCDMDSQKWLEYTKYRRFPLSLGYWLEGMKMQRAEKILARKFDYCSCATRAEMDTLNAYNVGVPTTWFPNGVDHEFFRPTTEPYDPDTICFIGRMDYFPNQECMHDFCANTLPLIRRRRPGVKLTIVGADPSADIRQLGTLEGVTVTGSVPDVRPYVLRSAVNVAPLNIARGTQNKILESLAMGVPVVTSNRAAGGIDAVAGEHFLTAASPQEYAESIIRLLENPAERQQFAAAGRARVVSHHDWHASMTRLDTVIEACLASRQVLQTTM
jgi:sugar transferase (PEP-CTERM/EpsH1 system associated)